ncbi:MAG: hypothetical protein LBG99_06940 [Propionibacteriaceae bacterium]|nr:hypothetical protein [Propionibacteriaceae bacterium]
MFHLDTRNSSYWFRITEHGYLEHLHYGVRLPQDQDPTALAIKRTMEIGTSIAYKEIDPTYQLDHLCLEWSGIGMGDFRTSPCEIVTGDDSYSTDFRYREHEWVPGPMVGATLPGPHATSDEAKTLTVHLKDQQAHLSLAMEYAVFPKTDVISRRSTLHNHGDRPISIRWMASMMIDLPDKQYRVLDLCCVT